MKPKGTDVAAAAVQAAHVGYTYDEMDCQAFVEHCVRQAGGSMDYLGTNDMARRAAWLGTLDEARAQGAVGLFGDKYGERVKVYTMGTFSKEICGGPHAGNTGELGHFKIKKEEASSSGVRRIKAVLEY